MKISAGSMGALVLALLAAACGMSTQSGDGSSASAAAGSSVVQGTVVGGSQGMGVGAPGGAMTTMDAKGGFVLGGVPQGTGTLEFTGGGHDAVLKTQPMLAGEVRHMGVHISGDEASEDSEQTTTEFEGKVESVGEEGLKVAGRTIVVTEATVFCKEEESGKGPAPTLADLVVGTPVEIEGTLNSDGSVTAARICIEEREDGERERTAFVGVLQKISEGTLTVGDVVVNVDPSTVIAKGDATIALADLAVGDRLLVRGAVQPDGSVNATRIRVLPPQGPAEDLDVSGKIAKIDTSASTLTIGDTVVSYDQNTEVEGAGNPKSVTDLKVGDSVIVEAVRRSDGTLLAKEVKRFTPPAN